VTGGQPSAPPLPWWAPVARQAKRARDSSNLRAGLQVAGTVGLPLSGVVAAVDSVGNPWYWVFLIGGLVCAALAIALGAWSSREGAARDRKLEDAQARITSLEAEMKGASAREREAEGRASADASAMSEFRREVAIQMNNLLQVLCEDHGFSSSERITVYRKGVDGVTLIARYSQDAELTRVAENNRRREFGFDHGLIGKVAKTGSRITRPDGPSPNDWSDYRKWQKELGLKVKGAMDLGMHSRTYDVVPIKQGSSRIVVSLESVEAESDEVRAFGDALEKASVVMPMITTLAALLHSIPIEARWSDDPDTEVPHGS
jgi:hypothetical protein